MAQARIAIVTGAASNGLGRAIALRLAQVGEGDPLTQRRSSQASVRMVLM